jgi:ADP-heptose:LPS heptosyltransferase
MTLQLVADYRAANPGTEIVYRCAPGVAKTLKNLMLDAGVDVVIDTDTHIKSDKQYDLIGYPLAEGYPEKPMRKHLLEYFGAELGVTPRLGLTLPHRPVAVMEEVKNYITVHVQAGWSQYKNWDFEKWEIVCRVAREHGVAVYQIGGPDDHQLKNVDGSFCGQSFDTNLLVLGGARVHLGVDSWTNHATNINWTSDQGTRKVPAVILWGSTQPSAAGYSHNENLWLGLKCAPCFREDPKISRMSRGVCPNPPGQSYETPKHECMAGISAMQVIQALWRLYV